LISNAKGVDEENIRARELYVIRSPHRKRPALAHRLPTLYIASIVCRSII